MNFLFVALGGAVGAMARYAISLIPLKTEFPFLTLITNVVLEDRCNYIFSLESYNLFEHNHCLLGCGYVLLSCLGCILGVMCGEKLATIIK